MTHTFQHAIEGLMSWFGPLFLLVIGLVIVWMLLYGPRFSWRST